MKKVYCIIFDYRGYEEHLQGIYEEEKEAIEQLVAQSKEYEYDNVVDYMTEGEISLVEWECGLNNKRIIKPSYDWV